MMRIYRYTKSADYTSEHAERDMRGCSEDTGYEYDFISERVDEFRRKGFGIRDSVMNVCVLAYLAKGIRTA